MRSTGKQLKAGENVKLKSGYCKRWQERKVRAGGKKKKKKKRRKKRKERKSPMRVSEKSKGMKIFFFFFKLYLIRYLSDFFVW